MFVHPSQVAEIVKRHPEILKARLVVDNPGGNDRMTLQCEVRGAPPAGLAQTIEGQRAQHHQAARRGLRSETRQAAERARRSRREEVRLKTKWSSPNAADPLAGIRVLDLTRLLPGPMATLHLADMGADVIKIEDTEAGDYSRSMGNVRKPGNPGAPPMSDFFRLVNRNKRAMRLDLKQVQGREVFLRLAKGADVVVEGFRPGSWRSWASATRRSLARTHAWCIARSPATGRTGPTRAAPATMQLHRLRRRQRPDRDCGGAGRAEFSDRGPARRGARRRWESSPR